MSTRAFRTEPTEGNAYDPRLLGTRGAVDAAVAAVLVEGLANPQMHMLGGECPMLVSTRPHPEAALPRPADPPTLRWDLPAGHSIRGRAPPGTSVAHQARGDDARNAAFESAQEESRR